MRLPIGISTFKKIREDDHLYVDKTEFALRLFKSHNYVFLSRPRRFGKSLFLDTLKEIFEGNRELFQGLAIYDKCTSTFKLHRPCITTHRDRKNISHRTAHFRITLLKNQDKLGLLTYQSRKDKNNEQRIQGKGAH